MTAVRERGGPGRAPGAPRPPRAARNWAAPRAVATLYLALLLALSLLHRLAPREAGVVALTQVFAPYLFLPLPALAPVLIAWRAALPRLLLLACCLVAGARFAPRPHPVPPSADPAAAQVTVLTWNLYIGNRRPDEVRRFLTTGPAEIVALQEVNEETLAWLARDERLARLYPHRLLDPRPGTRPRQIVLLSVYPIVAASPRDARSAGPDAAPLVWARLDLGRGRRLVVATAHPVAPDTVLWTCERPLCYAPTLRDADLAGVRAAVTPFSGRGEPFLLAGDFNVTEREPAYRALTAGLQDAHARAGRWPGHTWRPHLLLDRALPLLRIDYLLSSAAVTPLGTAVDCTPRGSDHCSLHGRFAVR